jgi:hypothetical protein
MFIFYSFHPVSVYTKEYTTQDNTATSGICHNLNADVRVGRMSFTGTDVRYSDTIQLHNNLDTMISHRGYGRKASHFLRLGTERNQCCLQRNMECPRAGLDVKKYPHT